MFNSDHYSYKVIWSDEDQEFVGLCSEFPSLSCLDEDRVKALSGIKDLVEGVVAEIQASSAE